MKAKRRALAERREVMGHTQETLAEFVGVESTTMGRWERGETSPQPWCRPTLAEALKVALEELDGLLAEGQPIEATADTPDEPVEDPEAELGRIAGWSAYDTGQPGLAQRYNIAALRAAHSADDRRQGAHILSFMAYQATRQGRSAEAVTLINTAVAGVRGQETPALLAELYIKHADALATLGDASGCAVAISKARTQVERLTLDNEPPWLYWVTPAEITAYAGQCLLQSGQVEQAIVLLDEGIALFDEAFPRNRQAYLTHQANALTRPGKHRDLEAAAGRGVEALQLAESLDSTHSVDLLRDLYRQMRPHGKVPAAADFLNRAQDLVQV